MNSLAAVSPATTLILKINNAIVNPLIIVMFSFALVAFLWGVRGYVTNSDNSEARQKGTQHILWGITGMAIMLMSFTIIRIVLQTFGFYDSDTQKNVEMILK